MRHFLHVPYPPQVESIAIPFQDAAFHRVLEQVMGRELFC